MDIADLIKKKFEGRISPAEEKFLEDWIQESDANKFLFFHLKILHQNGVPIPEMSQFDKEIAWTRTMGRIEARKRFFDFYSLCKYAAILIGVVGMVSYMYLSHYRISKDAGLIDSQAIILQFDNGGFQTIPEGGEETIITANGHLLGAAEIGQLDYSTTAATGELIYNTIKIPNGRTFKVVLSDSSVVHLNAGSSLRFPIKFLNGGDRRVFLSGEAYFEVSKDTLNPFIVSSGQIDVRVLGTQFNVTSYPEDLNVETVLVEGSVKIYKSGKGYDGDTSTLLSPGNLATWDANTENFTVERVDTKIYTAWMNRKLVFKKSRFYDIVKRLERHYNVTINNEYKELDERVFTATFDFETVQEVLATFDVETHFDYHVSKNEITIRKPKYSTQKE